MAAVAVAAIGTTARATAARTGNAVATMAAGTLFSLVVCGYFFGQTHKMITRFVFLLNT